MDNDALKDAIDMLRSQMAFSSRDHSAHSNDAWMYGIVLGWDLRTLHSLAAKWGWSEADIERLQAARAALNEVCPRDEGDDEHVFGDGWIYCAQHLRPHTTGWCTVSNREKQFLHAETEAEAIEECNARGLPVATL